MVEPGRQSDTRSESIWKATVKTPMHGIWHFGVGMMLKIHRQRSRRLSRRMEDPTTGYRRFHAWVFRGCISWDECALKFQTPNATGINSMLVAAFLRDETDRVSLCGFFCGIELSVPVKREPYSLSCKVGSTATTTAGVTFEPASHLISVPPFHPHRLHSGWAYRCRVPSNETHEMNN